MLLPADTMEKRSLALDKFFPFRYHGSMNGPRHLRNLAIAGFMGVGKSTVGRILAAQLRYDFLDTDDVIESRSGRSITEIFTQQGEAAFRQMERDLVAELGERQKTVISTGGGLIVDPANLASLKQHALVVCLWATPEAIWERLQHQHHRPLLDDPDPLAVIRRLLAARAPFYRQSDILVGTEGRSSKEIAQHLAQQFRLALRRPPSS